MKTTYAFIALALFFFAIFSCERYYEIVNKQDNTNDTTPTTVVPPETIPIVPPETIPIVPPETIPIVTPETIPIVTPETITIVLPDTIP